MTQKRSGQKEKSKFDWQGIFKQLIILILGGILGFIGGHLKGYLFHICKNQQVTADRVEYLDLLLDLWIDAAGQLTVLDRDEVETCASEGVIGAKDLAWIDLQEHEITENAEKIISDFDRLQGI